VTDAELRAAIEAALGRPARSVERRPGAYASSFAVEELEVGALDGSTVRLILKDVSTAGLAPTAVCAKSPALLDAAREPAVYRELLRPWELDVPVCHASGPGWLLLEAVDGTPLWQCGAWDAWKAAARWLGDLHRRGAPPGPASLVRYDGRHLDGLLHAALAAMPGGALDAVVLAWERAAKLLVTWPQALVHGDFYPSNVLVAPGTDGPRIRPVDWELAGIGAGLLDLAALTAGRWTAAERERLAVAYRSASSDQPPHFGEAFESARLAVAVGWLGRSAHWTPPPHHAQDWLAVARDAAGRLGR
jgi:hypothetical protein